MRRSLQGAAFVPHGLAQLPLNGGVVMSATGATTSPGADSGGTPFGEANAYPIAVADSFKVTEDELSTLNVLANVTSMRMARQALRCRS